MKGSIFIRTGLVALFVMVLAACAPTQVQVVDESSKLMPRPEKIYVYNFAVSPDEVILDHGISGDIQNLVSKQPRTEQEKAIGRAVANALAANLTQEIWNMGLPAERMSGPLPGSGNIVLISGQFTSIDEGNQAERVVIGLGVGRTSVKTYTRVLDARGGARKLLVEFQTDAASGYKPGMAETMGAGAVAGHVGTAAAIGGGLAIGSEAFSANVEADAKRTAKDIAKQLKDYFAYQGWVQP